MKNLSLEFEAFLRSVKGNINSKFSFLLGAGCSITSGIQAASDCIWEWKYEIFKTGNIDRHIVDPRKSDESKKIIQNWIDQQNWLNVPENGSVEEYSFYFEKAYPIEADRVEYFKKLCHNITPYIGYKLLCLLNKYGLVQTTWTTNIDGLVERAAQQLNISPKNITLDRPKAIYESPTSTEMRIVALHGDYKYSSLKNTTKELDNQNETFVASLIHSLSYEHLIVIGYSGRDKSLMTALAKAFESPGSGRLYWCGYGSAVPMEVQDLIEKVRTFGREAFYIDTNGFDNIILSITNLCFEGDPTKMEEIQRIISSYPAKQSVKPFAINGKYAKKILALNMIPVLMPCEALKFRTKSRLSWEELRSVICKKDIVAIPYREDIYAFATATQIREIFSSNIWGDIERVGLDLDLIERNSHFKSLALDAILHAIAKNNNVSVSKKSKKVWRKKAYVKIGNCIVHEAISLNLVFKPQVNYALLSIKPSLYFENRDELSKDTINITCRKYLDKLYNSVYYDKIQEWLNLLFGGKPCVIEIPQGKASEFKIKFGCNIGFVKELSDYITEAIPEHLIDSKKILFEACHIEEPKLKFQSLLNNGFEFDDNPMRGLKNYLPIDIPQYKFLSRDITLGLISPMQCIPMVLSFLNMLNYQVEQKYKGADYVSDYGGFEHTYKCLLDIPEPGSDRIKSVENNQNNLFVISSICRHLKLLSEKYPGIVTVIYIPKFFGHLKKFNHNGESFDLHDYIKAYGAREGFTTQIIEEETISKAQLCEKAWWLSLAIFVKALRSPWSLVMPQEQTAFAGIGYSLKKDANGKTKVVIGCSHIYDSEGHGLKYKLTPIRHPVFDKKNNPYLNFEEAYKFGMTICELFAKSLDKFPKRVVIHKRTPFKKDEVEGIVSALQKAKIHQIDLLTITTDTDIRVINQNFVFNNLIVDRYPIKRGTCIRLSGRKALLWTEGCIPSVNPTRPYYPGGRGIPSPIMITKYFGDGDLETICKEILGLCKMNWNSFNYYTKLPATVDTSNTLAHIGNLLAHYNEDIYDYRYFI